MRPNNKIRQKLQTVKSVVMLIKCEPGTKSAKLTRQYKFPRRLMNRSKY